MNFATATIQPAADSVESDCNPTQARHGSFWHGLARHGRHGQARRGLARLGLARHGRLGKATQGEARQGMAGKAGQGAAWQARRGAAWHGMARHGEAWQARRGAARPGEARHGRHGTNRSDRAGYKWIANNQKNMKLIKEENDIESKNDEIKKQLEAIANRPAGLNPRTLLTEAANPLSCLHKYFEWDDTEAALKWREAQAYDLIRRIKVEIITPENRTLTVRAFWPIKHLEPDGTIDSGKRGSFILFNNIMDDAEATRQVIANAKSELIAFHTKYSKLAELLEFGALFDEIKKLNSK